MMSGEKESFFRIGASCYKDFCLANLNSYFELDLSLIHIN